eukprot:2891500-Rhodomonas_salina.5
MLTLGASVTWILAATPGSVVDCQISRTLNSLASAPRTLSERMKSVGATATSLLVASEQKVEASHCLPKKLSLGTIGSLTTAGLLSLKVKVTTWNASMYLPA